jgi:NDP-sugar pyrophosphorylase family protein
VKLLLQADLPVNFYPFIGYWLDIEIPEDYAAANDEFRNSDFSEKTNCHLQKTDC